MNDPAVVTWDWREQIPVDELRAAIRRLSDGAVDVAEVDTGSDEYAIVLAAEPLDDAERVQAIYRSRFE